MIRSSHRYEVRRKRLATRHAIENPAPYDERTGRVGDEDGTRGIPVAFRFEYGHSIVEGIRKVVDGYAVVE